MTEQLFQNTISCPGLKLNPKLTPSQRIQNGSTPQSQNTELRHFEEGYFAIPVSLNQTVNGVVNYINYMAAADTNARIDYSKIGHMVTLSIRGFHLHANKTTRDLGVTLPPRLRPSINSPRQGIAIVKAPGWLHSRIYVDVDGQIYIGPSMDDQVLWTAAATNYVISATITYLVNDPDFE